MIINKWVDIRVKLCYMTTTFQQLVCCYWKCKNILKTQIQNDHCIVPGQNQCLLIDLPSFFNCVGHASLTLFHLERPQVQWDFRLLLFSNINSFISMLSKNSWMIILLLFSNINSFISMPSKNSRMVMEQNDSTTERSHKLTSNSKLGSCAWQQELNTKYSKGHIRYTYWGSLIYVIPNRLKQNDLTRSSSL